MMHLRRILERGALRSDVSGRALGGSLFTSTVAVCSSRAGRPAPQPSARGSGYWDATPAVWGCSVATIRGVQEPYGGGAPWRERGKKHGKIRQKVRLRSRVQGCDLTCHLLALASSRTGVHADFNNGRFLSNSTGFICSSSDCSDQLDIMPEKQMCCMSYLCQHAGLKLKGLRGLVLLDNRNTILHPDRIARGFIRGWKPFGKNKKAS